jgi:hypothetical protein
MKIKIPTLFRKGRERKVGHPLHISFAEAHDVRASRRINVESSK